MKVFIALFVATVAVNAQSPSQRQISLDTLNQIRAAIPIFQQARDTAVPKEPKANQRASDVLNNLYQSALQTTTDFHQSIQSDVLDLFSLGANNDPWCWEGIQPLVEGTMGWIGMDFQECMKSTDNSIAEIVAAAYGQFHEGEAPISKYSLFKVFQKHNVSNAPYKIVTAMGFLLSDVNHAIPADVGNAIAQFNDELAPLLPIYSGCLAAKVNLRSQMIKNLRDEVERCLG